MNRRSSAHKKLRARRRVQNNRLLRHRLHKSFSARHASAQDEASVVQAL